MSVKCEGCGADQAPMQCPTCRKLELPPSLFCSQDCFKKSWAVHKAKHSGNVCAVKTMDDMDKAMFDFTGDLRPGLATPRRKVPIEIPRPDYVDHPEGLSEAEEASYRTNKIIKWNESQIARIQKVCVLSREVLEAAMSVVKPGITTDEIDRVVHEACLARGVYPSPLGYIKFPKSCCTSLNEVICHGIPDSTVLADGDIVNIDISCYYDGMHGDLNETVFVGKPKNEKVIKLVHTTWESMMAGIGMVKPGAMYKHIGETIAPVAESRGLSVVRSIYGHGIGELFHCSPNVPHYKNNKASGVMKAGHIFTIEPMINEGSWRDVMWPDDWTVTTSDGKWSAQFEHTLCVTEEGYEIFTGPPLPEGEEGFSIGNDGDGLKKRMGAPFYQRQLKEWGIPLPSSSS